MNISITKNGKALDKALYTIDYKTRTFSSNEHCLVIDCPHDNWTFKTGSYCVLVRRDVYEVIELPENKTIKLNEHGIKGYTFVEEEIKKENLIKIGDKQISESTILEALKKYFEN